VSRSLDVSTLVAGSVQPARKEDDSHGCSLQASLKAIEHVCTPEKAHYQSGKKAPQKSKAGTKRPSNGATKQVPKKVCFKTSCKLCKKHGGLHTMHTTKDFAGTRKTEW
jgi:hypothetical protein